MVRQLIFSLLLCGVCHAADVRLAWHASPDPITGYVLYRSSTPITLLSSPEWRNTGNVLDYVWTGAPAGQISYWRLKAFNAYGYSQYSNEVSYTPPTTTTTTADCGGCGLPPCDPTTLRIVQ